MDQSLPVQLPTVTPRSLLPSEVRAIIMSRYILAKETDTSPQDFVKGIEDSLSAWALSSAIGVVQKVFQDRR